MQYKVPQDVQREDKIIGPFTLRQFLFLIGGAMAGYMAYTIFSKLIGNVNGFMLGFITFGGIAGFAVIQIQGMSLPEYVTAMALYITKPRKRIWQKDIYSTDIAYLKPTEESSQTEQKTPDQVKSRLDQLSYVLDTRGWSGPIAEETVKQEAPEAADPKAVEQETTTEPQIETPPIENKIEAKETTTQELPKIETPPVLEQKIAEETVKQEVPQVEVPQVVEQETTTQDKAPSVPPTPLAPPASPSSTRIIPPTDKKQEEIEKLLQIQERREKVIHREMNKMEERLKEELQNKFSQEAKEEIDRQKQTLKKLKSTVSTLEKETSKKVETKRIKKAKLRIAPNPKPKTITEDYSSIMGDRIATTASSGKHMNISVDESKLDDVLSEIENPTTDADFDKLSEAILAKKHVNKSAKIIKETDAPSYRY